MKKMMITLAILGITWCSAGAQTRTCHSPARKTTHKVARVGHRVDNTRWVNTYQVCRDEGGYYTCCLYKKTSDNALLR